MRTLAFLLFLNAVRLQENGGILGVHGWTVTPNADPSSTKRQQQQRQREALTRSFSTLLMADDTTSTSSSSTVKTSSGNDNILGDKKTGRINRDLAERIWNWEQERRLEQNLPRIEYSVRSGLRLIDAAVAKYQSHGNNNNFGNSNNSNDDQGDLIQEGLSALLDAMRSWEDAAATNESSSSIGSRSDDNHPFEAYAQAVIQGRLAAVTLDSSSRRSARNDMGRQRPTLSVESTVEILSPDKDSSFRDQEEWELRHGLLLDNGINIDKEELVEEYLDETIALEGDDEAWLQQEQTAGPLQDLVPDLEGLTPSDFILQELIRSDLSKFVSTCLAEDEIEIIRLYFGLDSGKPLTITETAKSANKTVPQVTRLLTEGLEELRAVYAEKYLSLDDDEFLAIEDSV